MIWNKNSLLPRTIQLIVSNIQMNLFDVKILNNTWAKLVSPPLFPLALLKYFKYGNVH